MTRRLTPAVAGLMLLPGSASAHDAFGDLGPFYASLLHPLADPAQAVVLAGFAVLLARQELVTVRRGYAGFAVASAVAVPAAAWLALPGVELFAAGALATLLGLAVLLGQRLPGLAVVGLGLVAASLASLAFDAATGLRDGLLLVLGGTLGLATATLLLWSLFDLLRRRIGDIACAVAGSWVAAVGIMTMALPR
jgi:hypothetical protein